MAMNNYACGEASCLIDRFDLCKTTGLSSTALAIFMGITALVREISMSALPLLYVVVQMECDSRLQKIQDCLSVILRNSEDKGDVEPHTRTINEGSCKVIIFILKIYQV